MWYRGNRYVIAGLEETLGMFAAQGVADFILDRIRNAPPEHKGHYINQLKQNPNITDNELMTGVATALDKQQSFTPGPTMIEQQIASLFPQHFQQWPLVYLRKMRLRPIGRDFTYRGFDDGSNDLNNQYYNLQSFFQQISDWATYSWQQDPRFQLAAYDFAQASALTKDWHDTMAGLGEGKQYSPYLRDEEGNIIDDRVVYTYPDGWHVTQVISKNDLEVEGNKMHHCFAPGALVRTINGFLPIETIKDGELVLCGDGSFRKVTRVFEQPYTGKMIKLATRLGFKPTLVTPNHEFLALKSLHGGESICQSHICGKSSRRNHEKIHDLEWTEIGNLSTHSYLVTQVPTEYYDIESIVIPDKYISSRRKGCRAFNVDEDFLWMIGMFIAEGSATENRIQFALSNHEEDFAERLMLFFTKHQFKCRWRKDKESYGGRVLLIDNRMLAEWFGDWIGKGCANKQIPSELLNLPNEKICALSIGILDGDGCHSRNVLHQTSPVLALQMAEISLRLGGLPSISVKDNTEKRTSYIVEGANALVPRIRSKAGFWQHKERVLARPYIFDHEQYSGLVYNLEVDTIHSYSVQNILVHNCVGGYCHNVASGSSRIFSLRDQRNHPVATIEMDGRGNFVKQIKAEWDAKPEQDIRLRLAEWFSDMGDVEWKDSGSQSWEPYWDSDPESLRGAIYDEAYGKQYYDDDDADNEDFHDDYGIGGGVDHSRNVIDLDVPALLESVESYAAPSRGHGTFDRIRSTQAEGHKWYSEEEHIAEPLADVIIAHDEALLKSIVQEKSEENEWTPERKRWTPDKIRRYMGLFDLATAYVDKHEYFTDEAFEEDLDEYGKYNEQQLAEDSDAFRVYYITLGAARNKLMSLMNPTAQKQPQTEETLGPNLLEMYQQLTGSNLIDDLNWTSQGSLRSIQTREDQERTQPRLMKHKDDYTRQSLPKLEDGTPDESVFDDGGWKYAKRKVDWYRFVQL